MVLAILRFPKLVDEKLYAVWRGSEEGQAPQMSHLLALLVVQAVGKVDGVVEKGGLCGRGGDDGYSIPI